ncbi:hypothetical protein ACH5RR_039493 [Cinchona calisaya]|uniref:Uncharacterized protein n=1 Tax=Cinchona calisaya TaxID=153742 RepID=A0ABD2Y2G8_9GENT
MPLSDWADKDCRGNGASVLRIVPYAALHFMTYEQYRCWILDNYSAFGTGPIVDLLAGSAAGGTTVLCTYPLDLARTKLAYQVFVRIRGRNVLQVVDPRQSLQNSVGHIYLQPAYTGIRNVIQSVYTEGGVRALYKGVGTYLLPICFSSCIDIYHIPLMIMAPGLGVVVCRC